MKSINYSGVIRFSSARLLGLALVMLFFAQSSSAAAAAPGSPIEPEAVVLEAFEVYASSQDAALDAKRQNDRVGSFLSSDAIGVLPDDNLGDALSRLAGVNVVGSQVVVRGAEGKLNNLQIDGLSPANVSQDMTDNFGEADSRGFEVDQIPTELVASVEVIKSLTADLDGDSIGGIVNVNTANAFDFQKRLLLFKAEYRYKELNNDPGYGVALTWAERINEAGTMGVYLNVSYRDEMDQSSRVLTDYNPSLPDEGPDGEPQNIRRIGRIRPSANSIDKQELNINANFDWKISDNTTAHVKTWYSKIDTIDLTNEIRIDRGERSWLDYDNRGTADAELFLDSLVIDPVTNKLVSVGNVVNNNAPGTFTPVGGTETDFRQVEDFRPIRRLDNRIGPEERMRLMLALKSQFDNGGQLELKGALDRAESHSIRVEGNFSGQAPTDTRVLRAFWDQSDPLRPNATAIFKDVPLGSGLDMGRNFGQSDAVRLAAWNSQGYSDEEAQKLLAAGRTGENAPALLHADGTPVYWWESEHFQALSSIGRFFFGRESDQRTLQGDYSQPLTDRFTFKSGAKIKHDSRATKAVSKSWSPENAVVRDTFGSIFTLADFEHLGVDEPTITINDGMYQRAAGRFIDPVLLAQFQDENFFNEAGRPFWRANTPNSLRGIAAKNWSGEETVSAGYLMGTFEATERLTLIGGVRYEYTNNDFTWRANDVDPPLPFHPVTGEFHGDVNLERAQNVDAKKHYGNLLPSALAVYRLKNHVFRAAFSKTLARPDFDDLVPVDINQLFQTWGEFLGNPNRDIFLYNPSLNEQTSLNFDLAWEWYYADGGLFSVTLFQKKLKNFHLGQSVVRPNVPFPVLDLDTGLQLTDDNGNPLFDLSDQRIGFAANGADRLIEGVEISFQQSFKDLLPSPWDGFGVLVNYTFMQGQETNTLFDPQALLRGEFTAIGEVKSDGLTGQPEHITNVQLYWEKWGFSTRVAYNYVAEFDTEVFTPDRDSIEIARGQIDVSAQYLLPKRWVGDRSVRLFFEGRNLNREIAGRYEQIPRWSRESYAAQRQFVFGVRGEF